MNLGGELRLLDEYRTEIQGMLDSLPELSPDQRTRLQKEVDRKIAAYEKQIQTIKSALPEAAEELKPYEAIALVFRALRMAMGTGFLRRHAASAGSYTSAKLASMQEKAACNKSLPILDQSIAIYDTAHAHGVKAETLYILGRKEEAKAELRYILSRFQDDEDLYVQARKLLDEWENPPRGGCGCLGGVIALMAASTVVGLLPVLLSYSNR